jgi:hypothetical protein
MRAERGLTDVLIPIGIEKLGPRLTGRNLQKSEAAFPAAQLQLYLGIAGNHFPVGDWAYSRNRSTSKGASS